MEDYQLIDSVVTGGFVVLIFVRFFPKTKQKQQQLEKKQEQELELESRSVNDFQEPTYRSINTTVGPLLKYQVLQVYSDLTLFQVMHSEKRDLAKQKIVEWYRYQGTHVVDHELLLEGPLSHLLPKDYLEEPGWPFSFLESRCKDYFQSSKSLDLYEPYIAGAVPLEELTRFIFPLAPLTEEERGPYFLVEKRGAASRDPVLTRALELYSKITFLHILENYETELITRRIFEWYDWNGYYVIEQELLDIGPLPEIINDSVALFNNDAPMELEFMRQQCEKFFEYIDMPYGFRLYMAGFLSFEDISKRLPAVSPPVDLYFVTLSEVPFKEAVNR